MIDYTLARSHGRQGRPQGAAHAARAGRDGKHALRCRACAGRCS